MCKDRVDKTKKEQALYVNIKETKACVVAMDHKQILIKILTLIYRSRVIKNYENDDLIRTILNIIKTNNEVAHFGAKNTTEQLKEFCIELLQEKDLIAKEVIIQKAAIILDNDQKLLSILKDSIAEDYDDANNKRITTSLIKLLTNYYKQYLAEELLTKASYDLKFNKTKIGNFGDYLKNLISELEPLASVITTIKDPALVSEVDFENPQSIAEVFEDVKNINNNKSIYRFGWQALNRMTQGGVRRGEFVTIGALQHKYKTGFSLSLFMQIALHNSPIVLKDEKDKKPLLLRISFEDSLTNNLQFMYQYLKASEGIFVKQSDFENIETQEMTQYILEKLTKTGFQIKMLRVDPSQWTYTNVLNKVIELEAQGYAVHVLMLDYVTLLPTTGCTQGPAGTDKKDLVRRIRNFCSARNIAFITPLQLSSEAKMLIRNGVPEHSFVREIAEKGYYDGCKTIDQDIDLELFIHLFTHKRKKYLSVARGKHRIPTVIDDEDKYFILKFPGLNIPILGDIDSEDSSFKNLPKDTENSSDSLLEEVLS